MITSKSQLNTTHEWQFPGVCRKCIRLPSIKYHIIIDHKLTTILDIKLQIPWNLGKTLRFSKTISFQSVHTSTVVVITILFDSQCFGCGWGWGRCRWSPWVGCWVSGVAPGCLWGCREPAWSTPCCSSGSSSEQLTTTTTMISVYFNNKNHKCAQVCNLCLLLQNCSSKRNVLYIESHSLHTVLYCTIFFLKLTVNSVSTKNWPSNELTIFLKHSIAKQTTVYLKQFIIALLSKVP